MHLVVEKISGALVDAIQYYTILTSAILTLTKAKSAAAMTQMEQERKRAVAVRGEARTAFVKILKGGKNIF